jgi:hypothetical protein
MRKSVIFLLAPILILLLLSSCRESEPLAPEEPNAVMLSPSEGSTLSPGDVQVRIYPQNFAIVENTGQPNKSNEGHVIYYMDMTAPIAAGIAATAAPGTFVALAETSYTWPNVPPGQHVFTVQLVNNDDTPLLPPVAVRANVVVKNR